MGSHFEAVCLQEKLMVSTSCQVAMGVTQPNTVWELSVLVPLDTSRQDVFTSTTIRTRGKKDTEGPYCSAPRFWYRHILAPSEAGPHTTIQGYWGLLQGPGA